MEEKWEIHIFGKIPFRGHKSKCMRLENKHQNENLDYRKLSIGIKAGQRRGTVTYLRQNLTMCVGFTRLGWRTLLVSIRNFLDLIGDLQFNSASCLSRWGACAKYHGWFICVGFGPKFDDMRVPPVYGLVGVKCLRIWRICFDMPGGSPFLF